MMELKLQLCDHCSNLKKRLYLDWDSWRFCWGCWAFYHDYKRPKPHIIEVKL
ncbi:hypothetical protein LCGC14_1227930 [marine sediment metagenome]|uniref:Uncharacterized protein n=1 Tax=marine sediment metagenome TaxID=412755 RepID=A0A0F9L9D2_9ZZZZ